MQRVTVDEAQRQLPAIISSLQSEGEVVIMKDNLPVARLTAAGARPSLRNIQPASIGKVLNPYPSPEDDLLEEMGSPR